MKSNVALNKGLESVALALILAPEPFTTIPGIILLAAIQANKAKNKASSPASRHTNRFEDNYKSTIKLYGHSQLRYHLEPIKKGQIPHQLPVTTGIYDTNAWEHYRKNAYSYLNAEKPVKPHFSGLQKGLVTDEPIKKGKLIHSAPATTKMGDNKVWQHYRKKAYSYINAEKPVKPYFSGLQQGLLKSESVEKGQLLRIPTAASKAADDRPNFSGLQQGLLKKANRSPRRKTI